MLIISSGKEAERFKPNFIEIIRACVCGAIWGVIHWQKRMGLLIVCDQLFGLKTRQNGKQLPKNPPPDPLQRSVSEIEVARSSAITRPEVMQSRSVIDQFLSSPA